MFLEFQRNEYFWGYADFVAILGVYHIIGLYLRVISMHFRVKVHNGDIFGVAKISNIFWGT